MKKRKFLPYLLLALASIYIIVFVARPLLVTAVKVFFNVDMLGKIKEFVGWDNIKKVATDPDFHQAIKNSIIYVAVTVPISKFFGLTLAIIARKKTKLSFIYETLYSIPVAIATPTICMVFSLMYSPNIGLLNNLIGHKIQWLRDPNLAMLSVCLIGIWISTGHAFIYFLPAVRNIPQSVLDSAEIDKLSFWNKLRYVYYPYISPNFFYLLVTDIPGGLMMMSISNILTEGGPQGSTTTVMLYIYQLIARVGNYSLANAATLLAIIMMAIVLFVLFKLERKIVYYND